MYNFSGNGINDVFYDQLWEFLSPGCRSIPSRLGDCKSLGPCVTELLEPSQRFLSVPGRMVSPVGQLTEAFSVLMGNGEAGYLAAFNSQLKKSLSPGEGEFHGHYGRRLRHTGMQNSIGGYDQISKVIDQLKENPNTRRAVASIWHPLFDSGNENSLDIPCNVFLMFRIRNELLDLTVCNRSNDFLLGWSTVNVIQFSILQEYVSSRIETPVGRLIFFTNDMHLYTDQWNKSRLKEVISSSSKHDNKPSIYDYVRPVKMGFGDSLEIVKKEVFQDCCSLVDVMDNFNLLLEKVSGYFIELTDNKWIPNGFERWCEFCWNLFGYIKLRDVAEADSIVPQELYERAFSALQRLPACDLSFLIYRWFIRAMENRGIEIGGFRGFVVDSIQKMEMRAGGGNGDWKWLENFILCRDLERKGTDVKS